MSKFLKELVLWIIISLPLIYLAALWNKLPEIVPTHFNSQGVVNGWSHKSTLIYLTVGMGLGIYLLMYAVPYLDPKKRIKQKADKYYNLRLIITAFTALISAYIVCITKAGSMKNPDLILVFLGAFIAILGKFMKTMKPSYFVGFRTPWTLESDHTWEKTHQFAGPIWMVGGAMIALLPIFISRKDVLPFILIGIISIIVIVPYVYSYVIYKNEDEVE